MAQVRSSSSHRFGRVRTLAVPLLGLAALSIASSAAAAPFSIRSVNAPFPEFVAAGDQVQIVVEGPSAHAAKAQASVTVTTAVSPQLACAGLMSLTVPPALLDAADDVVQITLTQAVAATATLPRHCRIRGAINPRIGVNNTPFAIGFELRLPDAWSGRFLFQGGGGNDGSIGNATGNVGNGSSPALARGMAAVSTDGGHTGGSAAQFGFDPQARVDHAYNAYGKTAATARAAPPPTSTVRRFIIALVI